MFHFKKFSLTDDRSTMKVGTDAVLLGIAAGKINCNRVLDIGTGCGVISLLIAQQTNAIIDAIDIDEQSCMEAYENFQLSPWSDRLNVLHNDIRIYALSAETTYDLIVSNPPFFNTGHKKQNAHIRKARHDDTLTLKELIISVNKLLSDSGQFMCILPDHRIAECIHIACKHKFFLHHIMLIHPKEHLPPNRYILTFKRMTTNSIAFERLTIRKNNLLYTGEFKQYVCDFYLDFPY